MDENLPRASRSTRVGAVRLAVTYFLITVVWILGSDHAAALLADDAAHLQRIQNIKGIAFITLMAVLVGVGAARLARAEAARQRAQLFASVDAVTQLPNMRAFYEVLSRRIVPGARNALLVVDFREFARINTSFGRLAGDQALFSIGRRLSAAAGDAACVARLEEDKFAVLLPDASAEDAELCASRTMDGFRSDLRVAGRSLGLDLNVGYACAPDDATNVAALLDAAELALRAAKDNGPNTIARFETRLQQSLREHFHLEAELRRALADQALSVHFQPQYDLASGALIGAEALVRWTHPERGPISPAVFIPVAEKAGLIDRVGEFVLMRTCQSMRQWREAALPSVRVAVNVAGHQLDDERLGFFLQQASEDWGVPLSALEVEITETMAMRDPDHAVEVLTRLRQMGVTIALDDFGTGYSSLSYLLRLPVDKLKIDRSFIAALDDHAQPRAFVRALIDLGRNLGMEVVAEGIESQQQCETLRELGCRFGQGFLLGRPMPADEFMHALRASR